MKDEGKRGGGGEGGGGGYVGRFEGGSTILHGNCIAACSAARRFEGHESTTSREPQDRFPRWPTSSSSAVIQGVRESTSRAFANRALYRTSRERFAFLVTLIYLPTSIETVIFTRPSVIFFKRAPRTIEAENPYDFETGGA